ncbi:MAG: hypothetical protein WA085_06380, partial [Sphingobium sp.]
LLAVLDGIAGGLIESAQVWKARTLTQDVAMPATTARRALVIDDSPTVCRQLDPSLTSPPPKLINFNPPSCKNH